MDLDWKQDTTCPVNYSDEIKKWFKLNGIHGKNCVVQLSTILGGISITSDQRRSYLIQKMTSAQGAKT